MDIHSAALDAMILIMKDLLHWQVLLKNADSLNTSSEYQVTLFWTTKFLWVGDVFFHSLDENNIGKEGCIALSAALQECKEIKSLRWVWIHYFY